MFLQDAFKEAFLLLSSFDAEIIRITLVSVMVSTTAVCISLCISFPLSLAIGFNEFPFKKRLITVLNTFMALPTVVVGLLVYAFISRSGPLGKFELLFTPWAMIIGQVILATPIITSLIVSNIHSRDRRIEQAAYSLGATQLQARWKVLCEVKYSIMAAVVTGFGRIFAEVGVSMMLGGNIKNYTRNITTAIALQTMKGEFALGLALGFILLFISFVINLILHSLQKEQSV